METKLEIQGFELSNLEEKRIRHQLAELERRLSHRPSPIATLALTGKADQRRVEADLRVQLEPLGSHLVSHQAAEMPGQAVRLAVEDVERQLERQTASQRGEETYGVPSRRQPAGLRPNPPKRKGG